MMAAEGDSNFVVAYRPDGSTMDLSYLVTITRACAAEGHVRGVRFRTRLDMSEAEHQKMYAELGVFGLVRLEPDHMVRCTFWGTQPPH